MIVLGIDIGVTGALAAVDSRGTHVLHDLPTIEIKGERMVRRRLDARGLLTLVRQCVPIGESGVAVIEDVHTLPSRVNAPQAQGSLMHSRGIVEAVLEIAGLRVVPVDPLRWKALFGLVGHGKDAARGIAVNLYPSAHAELQRAKDHNRADSLLLAHYGLRKLA